MKRALLILAAISIAVLPAAGCGDPCVKVESAWSKYDMATAKRDAATDPSDVLMFDEIAQDFAGEALDAQLDAPGCAWNRSGRFARN